MDAIPVQHFDFVVTLASKRMPGREIDAEWRRGGVNGEERGAVVFVFFYVFLSEGVRGAVAAGGSGWDRGRGGDGVTK
jgi:hypothetical protein